MRSPGGTHSCGSDQPSREVGVEEAEDRAPGGERRTPMFGPHTRPLGLGAARHAHLGPNARPLKGVRSFAHPTSVLESETGWEIEALRRFLGSAHGPHSYGSDQTPRGGVVPEARAAPARRRSPQRMYREAGLSCRRVQRSRAELQFSPAITFFTVQIRPERGRRRLTSGMRGVRSATRGGSLAQVCNSGGFRCTPGPAASLWPHSALGQLRSYGADQPFRGVEVPESGAGGLVVVSEPGAVSRTEVGSATCGVGGCPGYRISAAH